MGKRLGILTFHTANNFGAVLQGYALKKVCEEHGYEVYFIRYSGHDVPKHNRPIKNFVDAPNKKSAVFTLLRSAMSYAGDLKKENKFIAFREHYMPETILCHTVEDIRALGFDAYIAGSDQIWNYMITGGRFDRAYFLDFDTTASKVIYAASSQDVPFPMEEERIFVRLLTHTDAIIGIREKTLANYSSKLTGIIYPVVLDPTLLAGKEIMDSIPEKKTMNEPYILIYQIDANPYSDISVKTIEKHFGMKAITLTVPRIGSLHGRKGDIGPEEFLGYLKNAEFLVTNSFHGVALSVIYQKQFFVYENGGVMSRINDLLDELQISGRKVCMVDDIDPAKKIDFVKVNRSLEVARKSSGKFLFDALEGKFQYDSDCSAIESHNTKDYNTSKRPFRDREKKDCCGCSACAESCPVNAIEMVRDSEGFLYPHLDESKCIRCGKCDKVCAFYHTPKLQAEKLAFGVKHKNPEIRHNSRSGAAFVAFSDWILQQGGVVYGAIMDNDFKVTHIRAENEADRDKMTKAKYVQSELKHIYPSILHDLKANRYVLFTGTPCQVAGLYGFLGDRYSNCDRLFTCDLVCHGVPSPMIWEQYINYIEEKTGKRVVEAQFRDKEFGWEAHCESFELENGKRKYVAREYTDLFYQHIMFRPSCAVCPFANMDRPGDITLGDFWGIEKHDPAFNDNRGVSLIFANTWKGRRLFEIVKDEFEYFECDPLKCLQPTLQKPSMPSPRREAFWRDYDKMDFSELIKKYTVPNESSARFKYYTKKLLYFLRIRKHP